MAEDSSGWLGRLFGKKDELEDTATFTPVDELTDEVTVQSDGNAAAGSIVGRVRENNEDNYLFAPDRGLFAVCDGMGGHAAGELASRMVAELLDTLLTAEVIAGAVQAGEEAARTLLTDALLQTNQAVLDAAAESLERTGMGSTAVIAILVGTQLFVANVGDSRAYLIREGAPTLLTRDHSIAAVLVEKGQLTLEEGRGHLLRNQLTSVLGTTKPLIIDYQTAVLQPGDRIVLCSDGLWDMVPDAEIAHIAIIESDPGAAVQSLLQTANDAGGLDNITAMVIHY